MKKIIFGMMMLTLLCLPNAQAYVIDGSIADWGVDLNAGGVGYSGYLDSHVPTGSTVDVVTEDNAGWDTSWVNVGPGYSDYNHYDAEAMYFDNDDTYIYFALVTGLPESEADFPAGDIFFSVATDPFVSLDYSFAVDVFSENLYEVGGMQDVSNMPQYQVATPWRLTRDTFGDVADENDLIGAVELVYSPLQNSHYVIEGKIAMADMGVDKDVWMHWAMKCGNDYLNLHGTVDTSTVPEPATVLLLGSGLFGLVGLRRRKIFI